MQACQSSHTAEKFSQNMFRTVAELSKGNEKSFGQPTLDMVYDNRLLFIIQLFRECLHLNNMILMILTEYGAKRTKFT